MSIIGQRTIHHHSVTGDIDQTFDLRGHNRKAWNCNALRVSVSYDGELASTELVVDFVDDTLSLSPRKRVFRDTSGALDFVSDNLGQGWLVPRKHSTEDPMVLRVQATGDNGVGSAHILVELWWEPRGGFNQ